jgi:hypothetical protein
MAETTTTMSWPRAFHRATRWATALIRSGEPTEVPPYFWTINAMECRSPQEKRRDSNVNFKPELRAIIRISTAY